MEDWVNFVLDSNKLICDYTLNENKEVMESINLHRNILDEIDDSLHLWYGQIDDYFDLLLHCDIDIEASCFLAINGYYEDAIAILRIVLETSLKKIQSEAFPIDEIYQQLYSKLIKQKREKIKDGKWTKEEKKEFRESLSLLNPSFWSSVDYLFSWASIQKFEELRKKNPSFKEEISELYKSLCSYVHPSKNRNFNRNESRTTAEYSKTEFNKWYHLFLRTLKIVVILLFFVDDDIFQEKENPSTTFSKLYPNDFVLIRKALDYSNKLSKS